MARPATETDSRWMSRALRLAIRVKGTTAPNPAVGAVLVRRGKVVAEGATRPVGGPHAERVALDKAGERARGATLYVTLEPCAHHGRTPPCADAVIAAGISRVVVAARDPNPLVAGKGLRRLRAAGIAVTTGVLESEASRLNEDFFWWITHRAPWVTLKLAMTLDGRIADSSGRSKWITSDAARVLVHEMRRRHSAIAVGSGTVRADNPSLSVRHVRGASPARVVFSSTGRIARRTQLAATASGQRTIVVSARGRAPGLRQLSGGSEEWQCGRRDPVAQVRTFLRMAYRAGIQSVLVEGGAKLAAAFLEAGAVNRACLFYAPKVLGGGIDGLKLSRPKPLGSALELSQVEYVPVGTDILVSGLVVGRKGARRVHRDH